MQTSSLATKIKEQAGHRHCNSFLQSSIQHKNTSTGILKTAFSDGEYSEKTKQKKDRLTYSQSAFPVSRFIKIIILHDLRMNHREYRFR